MKTLIISDWLIISAQVMGTLFLVYHIWKNITLMKSKDPFVIVSPRQLKSVLAAATIYITILWLIKASFIAFYWSLHAHLTKTLRWLLYFSMMVLMVTFLVMHLINFLWCRPLSRMFQFTLKDFCHIGLDLHTGTIFYVLNVFTDLIVMIIGLTFVYNIRHSLGPRQWFAAAFVFIIGSIPIIASTVRYTTVYYIIRDPFTSFTRFGEIELWSEIDGAFATYAACLPALRSLIRETREKGSDGYGKADAGSVVAKRRYQKRISETGMDRSFDEDVEIGFAGIVRSKAVLGHKGHVRVWSLDIDVPRALEVDPQLTTRQSHVMQA